MKKIKQYRAHIWCALCLVSVLGFSIERNYLLTTMQEGWKFLIIDDATYFFPREQDFKEAHEFHFDQARLACESLLNRSPNGIDNDARLKKLCEPKAYQKVREFIKKEDFSFKEKEMFQKVNIAKTSLMKMDDHSVIVLVSGQLVRFGQFSGTSFREALDFELQCHLVLNRNMIENGHYPTVIYDFHLNTTPASK